MRAHVAHDRDKVRPIDARLLAVKHWRRDLRPDDDVRNRHTFARQRAHEDVEYAARDFVHLATPTQDDRTASHSGTSTRQHHEVIWSQDTAMLTNVQVRWDQRRRKVLKSSRRLDGLRMGESRVLLGHASQPGRALVDT